MLLVGDADIRDVHSHAGAIEAGVPKARRVVINDASHLMYLEKPTEFSRIVTLQGDASRVLRGIESAAVA